MDLLRIKSEHACNELHTIFNIPKKLQNVGTCFYVTSLLIAPVESIGAIGMCQYWTLDMWMSWSEMVF